MYIAFSQSETLIKGALLSVLSSPKYGQVFGINSINTQSKGFLFPYSLKNNKRTFCNKNNN